MKENQDNDLQASIPDWINFDSIEVTEDKLILHLSDQSKMEVNQFTIYTIEAILLTAKEYNFHSVYMENAPIKEIGKFQLDQEIEVPIAVSKSDINK